MSTDRRFPLPRKGPSTRMEPAESISSQPADAVSAARRSLRAIAAKIGRGPKSADLFGSRFSLKTLLADPLTGEGVESILSLAPDSEPVGDAIPATVHDLARLLKLDPRRAAGQIDPLDWLMALLPWRHVGIIPDPACLALAAAGKGAVSAAAGATPVLPWSMPVPALADAIKAAGAKPAAGSLLVRHLGLVVWAGSEAALVRQARERLDRKSVV